MKRVRIALLLLMAGAAIANAQEYRVEHSLGYSYVNVDTSNFTSTPASRQNANGWEWTDSINVSKLFAIEGSTGGYYKTYQVPINLVYPYPVNAHNSAHVSDLYVAAGPRINVRPWFFHARFGADFLKEPGAVGLTIAQQGSFLGIFGGGIEMPFSAHFAFRTSADYAFSRHNNFVGSTYPQNNFRVGAALVYRWWRVSPRESKIASQTTTSAEMVIPALGILVANPHAGEREGAEVVEFKPGSVADLAGLRAGDVISAVDGRPIKTPMDLAVELSNKAAGSKINIEHTTSRYWRTETEVILPNKF